jgi:hypothetical protein
MRNARLGEKLILYWPPIVRHPFYHLLTMAEKFRGLRNGFILEFGLCLNVFPVMHSTFYVLHGWIYSENSREGYA